MLKMCVSDLKSAGWNLLKFQQVKKNTMSPLSYTSRCAQDDCNYQPQYCWGWEGDGHHHQGRPAPLYRCSCIPQGGCGDDDEESNTNNVRSDCRSHSPMMMLGGQNNVPTHVTTGDAEDVRKCLEISRLELCQI